MIVIIPMFVISAHAHTHTHTYKYMYIHMYTTHTRVHTRTHPPTHTHSLTHSYYKCDWATKTGVVYVHPTMQTQWTITSMKNGNTPSLIILHLHHFLYWICGLVAYPKTKAHVVCVFTTLNIIGIDNTLMWMFCKDNHNYSRVLAHSSLPRKSSSSNLYVCIMVPMAPSNIIIRFFISSAKIVPTPLISITTHWYHY